MYGKEGHFEQYLAGTQQRYANRGILTRAFLQQSFPSRKTGMARYGTPFAPPTMLVLGLTRRGN